MCQNARGLSHTPRGALHDLFVQTTQQNTAQAWANNLLDRVLTALQPQPGMQVFQYFDQRQHHVLTNNINVMNYMTQFQQVNFDMHMQIGRVMLQNVVNLLHNQGIPHNHRM